MFKWSNAMIKFDFKIHIPTCLNNDNKYIPFGRFF